MNGNSLHGDLQQDGKYLTFLLNEQPYGVHVESILQIIAIPEITPIPQTESYIKGVINRSGRITPVMDLRLRLDLPGRDYDDRTSIIVIRAENMDVEIFMGMIVDNVLEVIDIDMSQVDQLSSIGSKIDNRYIHGMAKVKGKVIILLDTNRILSHKELIQMKNLQQESGTSS